jgi:hypothetical protein
MMTYQPGPESAKKGFALIHPSTDSVSQHFDDRQASTKSRMIQGSAGLIRTCQIEPRNPEFSDSPDLTAEHCSMSLSPAIESTRRLNLNEATAEFPSLCGAEVWPSGNRNAIWLKLFFASDSIDCLWLKKSESTAGLIHSNWPDSRFVGIRRQVLV